MLYLKTYLTEFTLIDNSIYKDKIEAINKSVLPQKLLQKKKKQVKN